MATGQQWGSMIFGGLFIGVWLYVALFGVPYEASFNAGYWVIWGMVGLALAAAIYGARVTKGGLKVALFVVVGVAIGMLLTAFLLQGLEEGIASIVTFVGGGLIVSALPAALGQDESAAQSTPPARY